MISLKKLKNLTFLNINLQCNTIKADMSLLLINNQKCIFKNWLKSEYSLKNEPSICERVAKHSMVLSSFSCQHWRNFPFLPYSLIWARMEGKKSDSYYQDDNLIRGTRRQNI